MIEGGAAPGTAKPSELHVPRTGLRPWWPALLAAVVAIAVQAPRLSRPLDGSLASAAATYHVLFFRNWDDAGFAKLRGIPCVGIGGETIAERDPYLHHPVLTYWIGYSFRRLFGWNEAAFRLLPFLAHVLSALLLVRLAERFLAARTAALAGVLFAIWPLSLLYGAMPNPESTVLLFLLLGFLNHVRVLETGSTRGRWFRLLSFAIGCQIDWQVSFLAPALLVFELLLPKPRRLGEVFWLFVAGGLSLLLLLLYFLWAMESVGALGEHVLRTAAVTLTGQKGNRSFEGFLEIQRGIVSSMVGLPAVLILLLLFVAGVLRPARLRSLKGALVVASFVPFLLNFALFRVPAYDHEFYWMPGMIGLCLGSATALEGLHARSLVLGAGAELLLAGSLVWLSLAAEHKAASLPLPYREVAALLDRFAVPEDLVLTPERVGPAMFYAKVRLYEGVTSVAMIEDALKRRRHYRKLHVFLNIEKSAQYQDMVWWLDKAGAPNDHPGIRGWILRE